MDNDGRSMVSCLTKLSRKAHAMDEIIIVSGLPRSGTSMMMQLLEAAGLEILTDRLRTADSNNPKGYYEFERVKKLKSGDFEWLPQARGKVVKVISALLRYLPSPYPYKIIFMRRDLEEILSSQRQMFVREGRAGDQIPDEKLAALYSRHLLETEAWLERQPQLSTLFISYNEILRDPEPDVGRVKQFLDRNLDVRRMLQAVDRNLYRERRAR